jgi:two-component system NtrC family response regulator
MPQIKENSSRPCVLVVEDDPGLQKQLGWALDDYEVVFAATRQEAIAALRRYEPAAVLQDLGLPPDPAGVTEGFEALKEILALAPRTKVIVVTGNADRDNALLAVRFGAYDYYQKPIDVDVLKLILDRACQIAALEAENRRLASLAEHSPIEGIIAADDATLKLCRTVEKIAPADISVLILGESGTGKELFARAVHNLGPRAQGRFVAINCAAIPENLLESELFGYEKGAFTGAHKQTPGKVELASGGTLFLDEIGDMPASLQAKLLRFLQERVVERVGGREEIPVDVRVVCATNQDLDALIKEGRFRQDLFYRIGEVTLVVPPLRDRVGGISMLAQVFLQRFARGHGRAVRGFASDALAAMDAYGWPGNVRELESKVKTAVIMAEGSIITAAELGLPAASGDRPDLNLREVRSRAERRAVRQALAVCDGNISAAAELLGVTRPTLYDLLGKLGLREPGSVPD